jgi:aspartate/methionine/tyrosine aminotransferase
VENPGSERHVQRFPPNDIISLIDAVPRYDLAESVGPDLELAELLDAPERARLFDMPLAYGTAAGDPRLRKSIADLHGVDPDDLVITVGGMHALFLAAFLLCDRGDEVITTAPLFPLTRNTLEAVGAQVRQLPAPFGRRYQPDRNEFRALLSARTKLVSLASPQNPSGVAIPLATLRDFLALMNEICPDAYLLVDETYREAVYDNDQVAPSAVQLGPKVISIASLSKCHGAPGLRLGWAITRDPKLREQLVTAKFNTVISCSPLDEALGVRVLQRRERILGDRRRRLGEGLQRTAAWMLENGAFVEWVRPDAGALCCIRLKPSLFDDASIKRFADALAARGVRVADGAWFGDEARVFRLGFGHLPGEDFQAALGHVASALREASQQIV